MMKVLLAAACIFADEDRDGVGQPFTTQDDVRPDVAASRARDAAKRVPW
jgi:hypothetical protein